MTYRILANNLWVDEKGNHQLFLHIEINDGTEIWQKAERACQADIDLVVANPDNINDVASRMAERAVISRPQEKIDEENRRVLELEQVKLETAKENAKAEELKLEQLRTQTNKL